MGQLNKAQNKYPDLDTVINSFFTEEFDEKQAEIYFRILHLNTKIFRVQHSLLTEYVYSNFNDVKLENENNIDKEIFWQKNELTLDSYLKKLVSHLDKLGTNFTEEEKEELKKNKKEIEELPDRIDESIRLALSQYKVFLKKYSAANKELKEVEKSYDKVSDKIAASSKKLDNSTSEFISMLGIFSALIFAVFGGFDSLKSIFTNINKVSVSTVIINSSLLMIGLIILIFLLIQSISILSEKTFLACGCENISKCSHKFYERYPIFSFSIGLFLVTLLLGLLCRENIKLPLNLKLETVLSYLGLIIILMIPIYLIDKNIFKKISNLFVRIFKKISNLFVRIFKKILYYIKIKPF